MDLPSLFNLTDRVAVITGGAGLLGTQHASILSEAGGVPILVDLPAAQPEAKAAELSKQWQRPVFGHATDITQPESVEELKNWIIANFGRIDILINNAARNPKVEAGDDSGFSRLETFPLEAWHLDLSVGLTGAFLCSKILGGEMAARGGGVIVNIASDLALISPDQRLYRQPGLAEDAQPTKPITYSVVKTGLIGLTRYLSTYWAAQGVRVNAISPGGVENGQPEDFTARLSKLIPLGRMAKPDEYQGAILFLCSDASSYMTGSNLVVDGGRTCW